LGCLNVFIIMKYIVEQDRMDRFFNRYMDYFYDLKCKHEYREFRDRYNKTFGFIDKKVFYYATYRLENEMMEMFGKDVNDKLFNYLSNRFPDLNLIGVEVDTLPY